MFNLFSCQLEKRRTLFQLFLFLRCLVFPDGDESLTGDVLLSCGQHVLQERDDGWVFRLAIGDEVQVAGRRRRILAAGNGLGQLFLIPVKVLVRIDLAVVVDVYRQDDDPRIGLQRLRVVGEPDIVQTNAPDVFLYSLDHSRVTVDCRTAEILLFLAEPFSPGGSGTAGVTACVDGHRRTVAVSADLTPCLRLSRDPYAPMAASRVMP